MANSLTLYSNKNPSLVGELVFFYGDYRDGAGGIIAEAPIYYRYDGDVYVVYTDLYNGRFGFQLAFAQPGIYHIAVSEDQAFRAGYARADLNQTVNATPPPTAVLTIVVNVGGTTNPAPGSYTRTFGEVLQVTALPATGYTFSHFLINGITWTNANPVSITMDRDQLVECFFDKILVTLNVYVTGGGSVSLSPPPVSSPGAGVYNYDPGTVVTATSHPDSGYKLDYWLLDQVPSGNSSTIAVTMSANHRLDAVFVSAPLGQGFLEAHAYFLSFEVGAKGTVDTSTFTTPATIALAARAYTVRLTYMGITQTLSATVAEGKTVRVDGKFLAIPVEAYPFLAAGGGVLAIALIYRVARKRKGEAKEA